MFRDTKGGALRTLALTTSLLLVPVADAAGTSRLNLPCFLQQSQGLFEEHIQKGKAAYEAKNYKLAREEAQQALKLKKDSLDANLLLALALKFPHKPDDAIKYAKKATRYGPQSTDAHYLLAVLLYEKDNLKEAGTELDNAM